jgi:hypothetical protein
MFIYSRKHMNNMKLSHSIGFASFGIKSNNLK